jgi:DNA-binding Lrp family transcriptional regulator
LLEDIYPVSKVKLDAIDHHILEELRDDGRITNVELARRVGISAPPCLRRVRALEQASLIRGYHADLNGEALGYGLTVFAWIGLDSQNEDDLSAFERHMAKLPMIRECHMLTGEADFILKVVAKNWDAWQSFLTTELIAAPNVASVKTAPVLRRSIIEFGVPLDGAGGA